MDNKLERLFYIGLGSALAVHDKLGKADEEFKEWQKDRETRGKAFLDQLAERGADEKNQYQKTLQEKMKQLVSELGLATRDDLEALRRDLIAELTPKA